MSVTSRILVPSVAALIAVSTSIAAQGAAAAPAFHTIVVQLVERPGQAQPFGFSPAAFTASRGDTLRFEQEAGTMHNIHIKKVPKGAKLGGAAVSNYLTTKGQAYTLVLDARFPDGTYEIVCDPHDALGMHATLTVVGSAVPAKE